MPVSVIVPVYNAEKFVAEAVASALAQPATGEVILVEDGSPDDSLSVCKALAVESEKARLLRHPDGQNHGAGASRNLGISNARFPYIAFLDADDFFLPNRFATAGQVMKANPDADGVYEAVGVHFETEAAKRDWQRRGGKMLTTMRMPVSPEQLFEAQAPIGRMGHIHLNGCMVRSSVFDRTGLFDEHLRLHQDTAMFVRLAAVCKLLPGSLKEPVAMRRVHKHNRITAPRSPGEQYRDRLLMWATLWQWGRKNLDRERQQLLMTRFIAHALAPFRRKESRLGSMKQSINQMISLVTNYPDLIGNPFFWKSLGILAGRFAISGDLSP